MDYIEYGGDCPECGYIPYDGHEAKFIETMTIEYTCDECGYISTEYLEEDFFE